MRYLSVGISMFLLSSICVRASLVVIHSMIKILNPRSTFLEIFSCPPPIRVLADCFSQPHEFEDPYVRKYIVLSTLFDHSTFAQSNALGSFKGDKKR